MLRRAAWAAVLWCAAALYPFVLFMTAVESSNVGFLASAVLTVPTAALMRRHPLPVQAILILAWTVALVEVQNGTVAALQVLVTDLGVCYIAATRPRRVSVPVAVVTLAVQILSLLAFSPTAAIDLVTATVLLAMAVALMAGTSVRARRAHAEMLREQAREQAAAHAVTAERLRIARELHDMVAHSIGVIAIQAGVGGRVIDTQPAEARKALNAIEATSRETLLGLRRMLGALRQGRRRRRAARPRPRPGRPGPAGGGGRGRRGPGRHALAGRAGPVPAGHRPVGVPHRPGGGHQRGPPRGHRRLPGHPSTTETRSWRSRSSTTGAAARGHAGNGYGLVGMRERAWPARTATSPPGRARGRLPGCGADPPAGRGPMTIRVVLADDQPLVRAGLRVLIADTPDLELVGEAGTGAEAVRLAEELRPDVVVMDIRMPGMDGIEATR